jgi:hypothetical protein
MNARHRATLSAIFATPVRSDVRWADIERLFRALGATISEGRGSRIRVAFGKDLVAVFHRPHPRPETDRGALRSVREFLLRAGVRPEQKAGGHEWQP